MDVRHVAHLARIHLEEEEVNVLSPQFKQILAYVDKLQDLDTTGVPPTAHPHEVAMPLRADLVTNGDRREALLANAPQVENGLFVVPKVIEE